MPLGTMLRIHIMQQWYALSVRKSLHKRRFDLRARHRVLSRNRHGSLRTLLGVKMLCTGKRARTSNKYSFAGAYAPARLKKQGISDGNSALYVDALRVRLHAFQS